MAYRDPIENPIVVHRARFGVQYRLSRIIKYNNDDIRVIKYSFNSKLIGIHNLCPIIRYVIQ